jgi:hypothetical protein
MHTQAQWSHFIMFGLGWFSCYIGQWIGHKTNFYLERRKWLRFEWIKK